MRARFINWERLQLERISFRHQNENAPYGDCGVIALAAVAHCSYADAMAFLRGHKRIYPRLKLGFNGFEFRKIKLPHKTEDRFCEQFAKKFPEGRYILYCGGKHQHHYVPLVHGDIENYSYSNVVTEAYQAC